jgi:hypothetical protein
VSRGVTRWVCGWVQVAPSFHPREAACPQIHNATHARAAAAGDGEKLATLWVLARRSCTRASPPPHRPREDGLTQLTLQTPQYCFASAGSAFFRGGFPNQGFGCQKLHVAPAKELQRSCVGHELLPATPHGVWVYGYMLLPSCKTDDAASGGGGVRSTHPAKLFVYGRDDAALAAEVRPISLLICIVPFDF